jgi:xylulokinase
MVTVNTTEGAAYGAALLAGVGVGAWKDVASACKETVKVVGQTLPNPEIQPVYEKMYDLYRNLYPILKTTFESLASVDS